MMIKEIADAVKFDFYEKKKTYEETRDYYTKKKREIVVDGYPIDVKF